MRTAILIPARDEAEALPHLFAALGARRTEQILVVDNGSRDATADVARASGAQVVREPRPGYGQACIAGIEWLRPRPPDVLMVMGRSRWPSRP